MNTKSISAIFAILFLAGITLLAVGPKEHSASATATQCSTEKMSDMSAMPEHCNIDNCTPEEAAKCPYAHQMQESSTVSDDHGNCPMTPDCPPSKCNGDHKTDKATL